MKFEPDLVREILRICVDAPGRPPATPKVDGYTSDQVGHHVWLMWRAGLVVAARSDGDSSAVTTAILIELDHPGHELWGKMKEDALWRRALRGGAAISIEALKALLAAAATGALGGP